jgi:hypothetical protein
VNRNKVEVIVRLWEDEKPPADMLRVELRGLDSRLLSKLVGGTLGLCEGLSQAKRDAPCPPAPEKKS